MFHVEHFLKAGYFFKLDRLSQEAFYYYIRITIVSGIKQISLSLVRAKD